MSENFFIWHAYVKMFFLQCIFDSQQYTYYDGGKICVLLFTVWVKVYFCFTDSGCLGWIKNVGGLNDDFLNILFAQQPRGPRTGCWDVWGQEKGRRMLDLEKLNCGGPNIQGQGGEKCLAGLRKSKLANLLENKGSPQNFKTRGWKRFGVIWEKDFELFEKKIWSYLRKNIGLEPYHCHKILSSKNMLRIVWFLQKYVEDRLVSAKICWGSSGFCKR